MSKITSTARDIEAIAKTIPLPPNSVGHKISVSIPTIDRDYTIGEVRELLFKNAKDFDTINYIYVLTKSNHISGVISLKELFTNSPNKLVSDVMTKNVVKARLASDSEKVANRAVKYSLKAIPIVDENETFQGVIASDSIQKILNHEIREDFLRLSGIIPHRDQYKNILDMSIFDAFVHRVPWIIIGLLGGILSAKIISGFEGLLVENVILAAFIPLIAYVANAVGNQTQTLFIRDSVVDSKIPLGKYSTRQLLTSFLIAISVWGAIFFIVAFFWNQTRLAHVIGFSTFIAIMVATIISLVIPIVLIKKDEDPAIGAGPFATIIQDLLSILIYFSIAELLL